MTRSGALVRGQVMSGCLIRGGSEAAICWLSLDGRAAGVEVVYQLLSGFRGE